jgi:CHASE2 domain-containing sensor protein
MADIFISYSQRDRTRVADLVARLEDARWTVWIDKQRLESGDAFRPQIEEALATARIVLVLWSRDSVTSEFVQGEADRARRQGKLMAARLDDVTAPIGLDQRHAFDLIGMRPGEHHPNFSVLLKQIEHRLGYTEKDRVALDANAMQRLRQRMREGGTAGLLAVAAAFAAICLVASIPGCVPRLRLLSLEARHWVARLEPSDSLRVVMIDKTSERRLRSREVDVWNDGTTGKSQVGEFGSAWRVLFARAVERLSKAGASVIAFDFSFSEITETDDEKRVDLERSGTTALAAAIAAARSRGTAVVIIATQRDKHSGRLSVQPDIANALSQDAPRPGIVAHGCLGEQEGFATLLPLLFTGTAPLYSLGLASFVAFTRGSLAWSSQTNQLMSVSQGHASQVAFTGRGARLSADETGCTVAPPSERAVYRVLDPFPRELERGSSGVIAFEDVVLDQPTRPWAEDVAGKLVLIGQQGVRADQVESCHERGCGKIWGLSLQAASIDALAQRHPDETAIAIITPLTQLCWIAVLCLAGGWLRFANAWSSSLRRFGGLAGLIVADVVISIYLAIAWGLLVDTVHHIVALATCYFIVSRLEPAHRVEAPRARHGHADRVGA